MVTKKTGNIKKRKDVKTKKEKIAKNDSKTNNTQNGFTVGQKVGIAFAVILLIGGLVTGLYFLIVNLTGPSPSTGPLPVLPGPNNCQVMNTGNTCFSNTYLECFPDTSGQTWSTLMEYSDTVIDYCTDNDLFQSGFVPDGTSGQMLLKNNISIANKREIYRLWVNTTPTVITNSEIFGLYIEQDFNFPQEPTSMTMYAQFPTPEIDYTVVSNLPTGTTVQVLSTLNYFTTVSNILDGPNFCLN